MVQERYDIVCLRLLTELEKREFEKYLQNRITGFWFIRCIEDEWKEVQYESFPHV